MVVLRQTTNSDNPLGSANGCAAQAARAFAEGVEAIDGLELTGQPAMTVVGLKAASGKGGKAVNIYAVNDAMSARGWHMSALQMPPALHMCFTAQHADSVQPLLRVSTANLFWQALSDTLLHAHALIRSHPNLTDALPSNVCCEQEVMSGCICEA